MSVSRQIAKLFNIFGSGWYIFLNSFGDIPRIFVHYFQIIPKFLYVCLSVHWLTSLLKLDKYRDISCSWWYIFLNFFGGISGIFLHYFQIISNFLYVCQSISWLTSLLKLGQYRDNSCSGGDIFLKFCGHIPEIFLRYFKIISHFLSVCQSVHCPTSLLKLC